VSVWVHFLRRARGFVNIGAVPLDLSGRNLVVPMGTNGQLKLTEPSSIDHAHTVLPGSHIPLRRPVWIAAENNLQLPPEVREHLEADQQEFIKLLIAHGAPLPGTSAMVNDPRRNIATELWVNYSEPQRIQGLVDNGEVSASRFIQYAVGYDIHRQLTPDDPLSPLLAQVVNRLCAPLPALCFSSLEEAAQALQVAIGGHVAMASAARYQPRLPDDLRPARNVPSKPLLDLKPYLNDLPVEGTPSAPTNHDLGGTASVQSPIYESHQRDPFGSHAKATSPRPYTDAGAPEKPPASADWRWTLLAVVAAVALGIPFGTWLAGF
jgi:hypothetical protein